MLSVVIIRKMLKVSPSPSFVVSGQKDKTELNTCVFIERKILAKICVKVDIIFGNLSDVLYRRERFQGYSVSTRKLHCINVNIL